MEITYPTINEIIECNQYVLFIIQAKRSDRFKILSYSPIIETIKNCEDFKGDIYDKAVVLIKGLVNKHPFASGNRRTAFLITKKFILSNGYDFCIKDEPKQAKIMIGIRESYYTHDEIKEWLKNGKIKDFKR